MVFVSIRIFINEIEFDVSKVVNERESNILQNKLVIPRALNSGEKLKYIRKFVTTLVSLYSVKRAYLSTDDSIELGIIELLKIEGLIEESLSSCGVDIWR